MERVTKIKDKFQRKHQKARRNMERMQGINTAAEDEHEKKEKMIKYITEHTKNLPELEKEYNTDFANGLTSEEASIRLQRYGKNKVDLKTTTNMILMFVEQMTDPFSLFMWFLILLNIIAFALSGDMNPLFLAIIILITIITSAILSYQFVRDTDSVVNAFTEILPAFAKVKRDGEVRTIKAEDVVPGDIAVIGPGEKIPADCRVL